MPLHPRLETVKDRYEKAGRLTLKVAKVKKLKGEIICLCSVYLSGMMCLKRALGTVSFKEIQDKTFEVIQIIEKLCEFCDKPLRTEERKIKTVRISVYDDYNKLLIRAKAHDRVEVDLKEKKIYLCDHDYPGDVHSDCLDKYSEEPR